MQGAFSAICKAFCNDGDAIFGAKFEGFRVVHDSVYSPDNIESLRKSKYVQSDMGDSYNKIKNILESNEKVLFSGTPCQVAGLCIYRCGGATIPVSGEPLVRNNRAAIPGLKTTKFDSLISS